MFCFRATTRVIRRPLLLNRIRFQSKKPEFTNINDAKLRKIIEGTNFGSKALDKKQKQIEEERKKLEQEREATRKLKEKQEEEKEKAEKEERQANIAKANDNNEANFTTTDSGKLKGTAKETHSATIKNEGDNEIKLRVEDKIIATTEDSIDDSEIPNLAKEINETIQKEIVGLPSQKAKNQSQLTKKVSKYLDSAHDTILTVTRALNDVTGYSAIEKLKKSINDQEDELRKAKDNVKKCKIEYGVAIQKRSHSQREVNELLTRKHNWSPQDLERFTELYRNDHENENQEQECEKNLQDAESKVDGIQLKLTQSILTRYHEEQIWSDKIRRSSTWGTWVLMGLNVLLFVFASFIVEPWKRKKLVLGFEEKVKNVLVGISQQNEAILDPIISQLEPNDGKVDIVGEEQIKDPKVEEEQIKDSNEDKYYVQMFTNNWTSLKDSSIKHYRALISPNIHYFEFNKLEFGMFTLMVSLLSCGLGSIITLLCK
ncbi:SHE9 [Candida pseudojiufengensis]|uniref:SHE9 n=1 Tax=Candida pseudojiufengensis TaxID=497109 RepID=UPI002224C243|nr:SHE9 [Candida pseudojiufengensis]KAI5964755.1 SHE9 [Candida pseudojiufengensis]